MYSPSDSEVVEELKSKHCTKYTPMQYCIWSELIVGGLHISYSDAPDNNTMFNRAGGGAKSKSKCDESPVAQALTDAATAITSVLTPKSSTVTARSRNSPAKLFENRSNLYRQLSELHSLKSAGVLTVEEYAMEKEAIMELLQQLKSRVS